MHADETYSQWSDWPQDDCDDVDDLFDLADLIDGGRAAFAQLFSSLHQAALPPGAVVEIEFAVRRRAVPLPA